MAVLWISAIKGNSVEFDEGDIVEGTQASNNGKISVLDREGQQYLFKETDLTASRMTNRAWHREFNRRARQRAVA